MNLQKGLCRLVLGITSHWTGWSSLRNAASCRDAWILFMVVTSIGDAWVARPSSCWFISVHRGLHSVYCDLGEASDFGEVQLYSLKWLWPQPHVATRKPLMQTFLSVSSNHFEIPCIFSQSHFRFRCSLVEGCDALIFALPRDGFWDIYIFIYLYIYIYLYIFIYIYIYLYIFINKYN